jgi:hypothetical protein
LGSYQKFEMANFGIKLVADMAASVLLASKPLAYGSFVLPPARDCQVWRIRFPSLAELGVANGLGVSELVACKSASSQSAAIGTSSGSAGLKPMPKWNAEARTISNLRRGDAIARQGCGPPVASVADKRTAIMDALDMLISRN